MPHHNASSQCLITMPHHNASKQCLQTMPPNNASKQHILGSVSLSVFQEQILLANVLEALHHCLPTSNSRYCLQAVQTQRASCYLHLTTLHMLQQLFNCCGHTFPVVTIPVLGRHCNICHSYSRLITMLHVCADLHAGFVMMTAS